MYVTDCSLVLCHTVLATLVFLGMDLVQSPASTTLLSGQLSLMIYVCVCEMHIQCVSTSVSNVFVKTVLSLE